MNLTNFDIISIIAIFTSACCTVVLYKFVHKISYRVKRLEKKVVEIIDSYREILSKIDSNKRSIKKSDSIKFMEGDLDLVANNKKATFKAIYYPKKIKK
tara:strand:+ start:86 stop:382 length:297 start_codon:yes stop_codon:yes gene_type:complete